MTLELIVKATAILAIAALTQVVVRRASAEIRHMVWTLAIAATLLLPLMTIALPQWQVPGKLTAFAEATAVKKLGTTDERALRLGATNLAGATNAAGVANATVSTLVAPGLSLASVAPMLGVVYAAGAVAVGLFFAFQWQRARRVTRRASLVSESDWTRLLADCATCIGLDRPVRLLRDRERSMPMTVGAFRAAIVIPTTAETWSEDRRRAVILHELAHVARHDCFTQALAFVACTVYWFHPATWWVARRLRIERELACDDRVIAAGTQPREYAGHLLDIAYAFGQDRAPALAVSMARPRQLESRMLAALDERRNRRIPARRLRIAGAAVAAALLVPLAVLTNDVAAAPQQDAPTTVSHLKAVEWGVIESARAIIRSAAAAIGMSQDKLPGTWEVRPTKTEGTVHLRIVEVNSSSGNNVPIQQLEGLTAAQLTGAGGPVTFRMRRDAGTFTFEGVARNGVGAGTFSFAPDQSLPGELAKRGFARPSALEQYQMARHDIGYAFIDELPKQGYGRPAISELVRAGQHGVQVTYLREMGALGYRLGTLDPLITLRDHGVTPEYIRELADLGYKGLSADALREGRDHGVTPDYVRGLRDQGYTSLTMEQLVKARDHGVDPQFVRGLGGAGHTTLSLDQLIRVRDHGVTPDYVGEMRQLGHTLAIEDLVRARDHGVNVAYVRGIAALGFDKVPIDELISLRDHGVTPERIRAANARAGTRLPLDMVKALVSGGMR